MKYLLDASALLALLKREPGWQHVDSIISRSAISAVNGAEVVGMLRREGVPGEVALLALRLTKVQILAFDDSHLELMASGPGDREGLSLGDRVCLATARRNEWIAVTADRGWARFASDALKVEVIR